MRRISPVLVFAAIMRPSADLVAFGMVVIACAVFDAVHPPRPFDECYALALIFQMFAASTGFRERAARGHFDPLLTRYSRPRVAAAHLLVSSAPGVLIWLSVLAVDVIGRRHLPPTGLTPPALAAVVCVSAVAWTAGLVLPRYGAGIIWLIAIVIFAGSGQVTAVHAAFARDPTWTHRVERTAGLLVAPMLLFSGPQSASAFDVVVAVLAGTAFAMHGAGYITRFEAALQEVA